ncbi:MAG: hypothetical protein GYA33_02070 [Thermogutta sp.]|nr:hypothetical protein [Thermogutta sp.]
MRMPFGKYRGLDLEDIPESYLAWVLDHANPRATLREAIRLRLGICDLEQRWERLARDCERLAAERQSLDVELNRMYATWHKTAADLNEGIIGTWYRRLAREFHPDLRCGSNAEMKAINRARDLLLELTRTGQHA